jgi:hypothetical protein
LEAFDRLHCPATFGIKRGAVLDGTALQHDVDAAAAERLQDCYSMILLLLRMRHATFTHCVLIPPRAFSCPIERQKWLIVMGCNASARARRID